MRSYPRPVLQEWCDMGGFGGGTTSKSEADKLMDTLNKSSVTVQKEMLDKVLKKYFKISHDELEALLVKHNPEKLI